MKSTDTASAEHGLKYSRMPSILHTQLWEVPRRYHSDTSMIAAGILSESAHSNSAEFDEDE
jgi:hypothetical protein